MNGFIKIPKNVYRSEKVTELAPFLLGCRLCTRFAGTLTAGIIVETEAYAGVIDRASHAYSGRQTSRTHIMYQGGGVAYVYLCYGIHHLFNVVTSIEGEPHAILIRAIQPNMGIETILERRGQNRLARNTTGGPGLVTQALGISRIHNGIDLCGETIWIEKPTQEGMQIKKSEIVCSPRVGVAYAQEDALLPWRFRIKDNPFTSPAK